MHGVGVAKGGLSGEDGFIRIVDYVPLFRSVEALPPCISRRAGSGKYCSCNENANHATFRSLETRAATLAADLCSSISIPTCHSQTYLRRQCISERTEPPRGADTRASRQGKRLRRCQGRIERAHDQMTKRMSDERDANSPVPVNPRNTQLLRLLPSTMHSCTQSLVDD